MKKTILIFAIIVFIAGCGGNDSTNSGNNEPGSSQNEMTAEENEGLELITKSDCLTCHKVSEPLLGPAYEAIAEKYKGNTLVIDTLVQRIIDGSQGVWGSVPMTSHPTLSMEDARKMVTYVLSLKK